MPDFLLHESLTDGVLKVEIAREKWGLYCSRLPGVSGEMVCVGSGAKKKCKFSSGRQFFDLSNMQVLYCELRRFVSYVVYS